jgi:hypothetical protein
MFYEKIQNLVKFKSSFKTENSCQLKDIFNQFLWEKYEIGLEDRVDNHPDMHTIYAHYLKEREYILSGPLHDILGKLSKPPPSVTPKESAKSSSFYPSPVSSISINTKSKSIVLDEYNADEDKTSSSNSEEGSDSSESSEEEEKKKKKKKVAFVIHEEVKEEEIKITEVEEEEEGEDKQITWKNFFFENEWILYLEELCKQTRLEIIHEIVNGVFEMNKPIKDIYSDSTYLDTVSTTFRTNVRTSKGIYTSNCASTSDIFNPVIYNESPERGPMIIKGPPESYSPIGDSWKPHERSQNIIPCCSGRAEVVVPLLRIDETAKDYYKRTILSSDTDKYIYNSICPPNIVWKGCYDDIKYTPEHGKRFHPRVSKTVYKTFTECDEEIIRRIRDDPASKIGEFEPYGVRIAPPSVASEIESAFLK